MTTDKAATPVRSNFAHLMAFDEQLVRLGMRAEEYFATDPNTSLLKLRQHTELLAQYVAARYGVLTNSDESLADLVYRLYRADYLDRAIWELFRDIRHAGNAANHAMEGDHRTALSGG